MSSAIQRVIFILFISMALSLNLFAQDKKSSGPPPAQVVVSDVTTGMISPTIEFIGTVYYQEVSDVASEVSGRVDVVHIEDGEPVRAGDILVKLVSDLLEKRLEASRSTHDQILAELEKSRIDFERVDNLFKEESISEQGYDDQRFKVKVLERRASSLKSQVELLELELMKKAIKAPFDGVVVKRHVDRGEWLAEGSPVATVAKVDVVDIIANVPERIISFVKKGMDVQIKTGGTEVHGTVFTTIPRGDIATRTFPVKVRLRNPGFLKEGMEAKIKLPSGRKERTLFVPRDAVITMFGRTVVFAVSENKAKIIPVEVVGFEKMAAGIRADHLEEGMEVVVKGNERLRDGQSLVLKR
jgi:RND family efflux transporter MFP subunit